MTNEILEKELLGEEQVEEISGANPLIAGLGVFGLFAASSAIALSIVDSKHEASNAERAIYRNTKTFVETLMAKEGLSYQDIFSNVNLRLDIRLVAANEYYLSQQAKNNS